MGPKMETLKNEIASHSPDFEDARKKLLYVPTRAEKITVSHAHLKPKLVL